ncbi:MAG TPA: VIT1/CCC1 transporter family protein [Solirubrobacteraceae bacterium]|nr:VIT1/CCC1 transporter family protein [Solirubrobacteraceae bacterium]
MPGETQAYNPPTLAEARARLEKAWRGEILAGAVYELIARRMSDRDASILRKMAEAEGSHRRRLEQRMTELDVPIPDPGSVKVPLWLRLQARIAPVDRLLAAREAAEDDEVGDLYRRSTGDPDTDRLLREIRHEERAHSLAVQEIRSGGAADQPVVDIPAAGAAPMPTSPAVERDPRARLDRIMKRERWHRSGGGWISGAIYGANDGLAAVFGIVAGVSGATGGSTFVLTAGIAGALASALSMATGAFLAERSETEVAQANVARERQEIAEHPDEEKEELSLFYQLKGIDRVTADSMAEQLSRRPDAMLQALASEEFGGVGDKGDPKQAAVAAGVSTGIGAIIPVIPFIFTTGTAAIVAAAIISLIAHFLVGAAKSLVTLRTWWAAGLEMTFAGVLVGGATYLVGLALPT